ncbi:MAG: DUF4041 domain-containing protein [Aestuariibacter sp.]
MPQNGLLIAAGFTLLSIIFAWIGVYNYYRAHKKKKETENRTRILSQQSAQQRESDIRAKISDTQSRLEKSTEPFDALWEAICKLKDQTKYVDFGLPIPSFQLDHDEDLKAKIYECRDEQYSLIKKGKATNSFSNWTWFGSAKKGAEMVKMYCYLLVRAYNTEFEMIRSKMRHNSFDIAQEKLNKLSEQLTKLAETVGASVSVEYRMLKHQELAVWHDDLLEKERAKQARKEQRELLRQQNKDLGKDDTEELDEEIALRESLLKKAKKAALEKHGQSQAAYELQIQKMQQEIDELNKEFERAQSQAQVTRAGYIYVISNLGSFGKDVVKIGMTRRLEPMERVKELGDASVPFTFDVHTLAFVEDAPQVERALHEKFDAHRVNTENLRKEFFRVSVTEVKAAVEEMGIDADWFYDVEAKDYRESQVMRLALEKQAADKPEVTDFPSDI